MKLKKEAVNSDIEEIKRFWLSGQEDSFLNFSDKLLTLQWAKDDIKTLLTILEYMRVALGPY